MRKLLLPLAGIMLALPAHADETRKPVNTQDAIRQETVALGNNRFIIFSGTSNPDGQYGYTADLVKIDGGMPHFDPLFIEDYDADSNTAKLSYGVAFLCLSYRFDKDANTLTYTMFDADNNRRMELEYTLDTDIFKLDQVIAQQSKPCPKQPCPLLPPQTIFTAAQAQAH